MDTDEPIVKQYDIQVNNFDEAWELVTALNNAIAELEKVKTLTKKILKFSHVLEHQILPAEMLPISSKP